jgi:hypothetical protein
LQTILLARSGHAALSVLSMPDPDLCITLPAPDEKTSWEAAIATAYGDDPPSDANDLLSIATCKELLAFERIKEVLFLCKTDGSSSSSTILLIQLTDWNHDI